MLSPKVHRRGLRLTLAHLFVAKALSGSAILNVRKEWWSIAAT
jgi:hypothetical protein